MAKRAAIYARVSRAYQENEDRVTIEKQLTDCEALCRSRGYEVVRRYVDKDNYRSEGKLVGPSGANKDRPAYVQMLAAATAGEFDVIVAWKEDRLYRGMFAAVPFVVMLDKCNDLVVELVLGSFDRQMMVIQAAIGKIELDNIRDRTMMGRKARLERGQLPGGSVRYGYARDADNYPVIHPQEADVVRQVFAWYVAGANNMEIRRRLNADGITPRHSKQWSKATIQNILRCEVYATGEYSTKLAGESFTIACPVIIEPETWAQSLERRAANKSYPANNIKRDFLCGGLVVCSCGWRWAVRSRKNGRGGGVSGVYACRKRNSAPEQVHEDCPGTIGAKFLDDAVWAFVVQLCRDPTLLHAAMDARLAELTAAGEDLHAKAKAVKAKLAKCEGERQWTITQARKGNITEADMQAQLIALQQLVVDKRAQLKDVLASIALQGQSDGMKAWADQYLGDIATGLDVLGIDPGTLGDQDRDVLFDTFDAVRFMARFEGDRLQALRWAMLEDRRQTVRALVDRVLVVRDRSGEKRVIPQVALDIPVNAAYRDYGHQSPDYVPRAPGDGPETVTLRLSGDQVVQQEGGCDVGGARTGKD